MEIQHQNRVAGNGHIHVRIYLDSGNGKQQNPLLANIAFQFPQRGMLVLDRMEGIPPTPGRYNKDAGMQGPNGNRV